MNPEKEKNLKALESGEILSREQWKSLIKDLTKEDSRILAEKACRIRDRQYGKRVFIRGLIEFTNYCKNRLLLLRDPQKQQKRLPVPADQGTDPGLLQGGIRTGISYLCPSGWRRSLFQR